MQTLTFVVSFATLLAVGWQILRLETLQPLDGLAIRDSRDRFVRNGLSEVNLTFRAMGPARLYETTFTVIGATPMLEPLGPFPTLDPDDEPVTLHVTYHADQSPFVLIEWTEFTRIRRRPIMQARRYIIRTGTLQRWRWSRLPWREAGKWLERPHRGRYTVPESAIAPQNADLPESQRGGREAS